MFQGASYDPVVVMDGGLPPSRMNSILLTWDVEEYDAPADFGAPALADHGLSRGREIWEEWLGLTKEWKFPGTTFCTARLAQCAPELLRETAARGHEIASHGWSHRPGDDLQLLSSRTRLQEISGQGVDGFRSPRLRKINKEEITQAGFRYDASLNPTWIPGRYDHRREPRRPFQIGSLWEVPAAVLPGIRFPLFWASFHILPLPLYLALCAKVLQHDGLLCLYFHPWELSALPEPEMPRWLTRRPQTERIRRMTKLCHGLERFGSFTPVGSYLGLGMQVTRP
jgi:peptidoglycan/xylan/chitin deacetylase (PgdA/CDA1 family)